MENGKLKILGAVLFFVFSILNSQLSIAQDIPIRDEGTLQGRARELNFIGPGQRAIVSGGVAAITNASDCTAYVAPGTNTLQTAIDALPVTGGVICLGAGTYTETGAGPQIGNGTTSAVSTRHGVVIRGAAPVQTDIISSFASASATVIDCTGTTDGTCFKIVGPLEGWGLENLQINGATSGSQSYGVSVVSAKFGNSKNLFIKGFKRGIDSTTHATFSGGGNFDSFGNIWENLQIVVPSGGTHYGMVLGTASTGANTDFNLFKNTFIWPAASGTACMQMNWTDGIIFHGFTCVSNGDIFLDYTAGSGRVPNNNYWYGLEMGGAAVTNIGSPGGSDKLNYIFGFSETNASACPNITGTLVYGCSTSYVNEEVVRGLTASRPVISDSNKKLSSGSYSGNTTKLVTMDASSPATNDCAKWDANDNITTAGGPCGGSLDITGLSATDPALDDEVPVYDVGAAANRKVTVDKLLALAGYPVRGRLTTESGVCVSTSDRTSQGTIYFTPCGDGNVIALYDGTRWKLYTYTERSYSVSCSADQIKDLFLYDNAGTLTLEASAAWTNDTTRADALTTQDGVYVKSGATTRRWLGAFRCTGSNVAEDSGLKRFIANAYNREPRRLIFTDGTNHQYNSGTVRKWNDATARVSMLNIFPQGATLNLNLRVAIRSANGGRPFVGVGIDTETAYTTPLEDAVSIGDGVILGGGSSGSVAIGMGFHYASVNEDSRDGVNTDFFNVDLSGIVLQ